MIALIKRLALPLGILLVVILLVPLSFAFYIHHLDTREPSFEMEFPITVDPVRETIVEDEKVNAYFETQEFNIQALTLFSPRLAELLSFFAVGITELVGNDNFALVSGERFVTIYPGQRKEEVARAFAVALDWNESEKKEFMTPRFGRGLPFTEGSFFPGVYSVSIGATPFEVQEIVNKRFSTNVLSRYSTSTAELVPINTALTIASLIQRETIGTRDMRLVSGIIWNRIFANMKLQLDATLQYARANNGSGAVWWPSVASRDKYIRSPYNTYLNNGLPPSPIANPSVAAIIAALNPEKTNCLFYFHDKSGQIYCTPTYEEHVAQLKQIYGRGK